MAKKPDAAAELAARMTQALEAERARGGAAYPTPLGRLRDLADPGASAELVLKAVGKPPLSERAVVAKRKSLTAPVALRADLEQFLAGRQLLEFALEVLYAAGTPPWPISKVSGQLDRPLRAAFEATVARQVAAGGLPDSVAVVPAGRKPALYLKRQPPPPPPEVELADRLLRVLDAQRRRGPGSYPLWLSRLIELAGTPAKPAVLRKAQKVEAFLARTLPLMKRGKDQLIALRDDLEQAVGSPAVLLPLLDACRTGATQAFPPASLKAKLTKPARGPFLASLTRQIESGSLPAGVGWLTVGNKPLLFRLDDVRGRRVSAAAPAPPAGFEAAFDEAFARLDRAGGSYNFVSLVDLRRALPFDRATFDAQLRRLREAGRYTLSAAEGRHGITEEQRGAGITEDGTLLLFASRR